ncbi:hypothetical protein EDB19DRAFT_1911978 [Suillus lakei]|nr:hypothetical protein EDB19DRAFT_1911978 [Suillus lakei]
MHPNLSRSSSAGMTTAGTGETSDGDRGDRGSVLACDIEILGLLGLHTHFRGIATVAVLVQMLYGGSPCADHFPFNMPNQYKPTLPLDEIVPQILRLWKTCQTDRNMVRILREKHIDTEHYGIGLTKLREI